MSTEKAASGPSLDAAVSHAKETGESGQASGATPGMSNRVKGLLAMTVNIVGAVLIIPVNKWLFKNLAFKWVSSSFALQPLSVKPASLFFPFRCWLCRCFTTA